MGLGVGVGDRRVAPKLAVLTTIVAAPHSKSGTRTRSAVYMRGITSGSRAINAESCCAGGTLVRWHSPHLGQVAAIRPRRCRHVGTTKGENSRILSACLSVESGCGCGDRGAGELCWV